MKNLALSSSYNNVVGRHKNETKKRVETKQRANVEANKKIRFLKQKKKTIKTNYLILKVYLMLPL